MIKRVLAILLGMLLILCNMTPVICSAKATIDNDGKIMKLPFGDSKIPASFKETEYYDCYVPYAETYGTIGGYAVGGNSELWAMKHKDEVHIGDKVTYENDMFHFDGRNYWDRFAGSLQGNTASTGVKQGYEADTGLATVTDRNGTTYYITALQFFFTSFLPEENRSDPLLDISTGKGGYYGFGLYCNAGQIFDVILTDGTVIHFAVGDAAGQEHCNGGNPQGTYGGIDNVSYTNLDMTNLNNHRQYTNIFQAGSGNTLELWGKDSNVASKFADKYNLKTDGSGNHIAYYRMYKAMVKDAPKPASTEAMNVAYSLGGVNFEKSKNDGDTTGFTVNGMTGYDEAYFVTAENKPIENTLVLLGSDSLSSYEKEQLYYWKQNLSILSEQKAKSIPRIILMTVAIIIIGYALALLVCFEFDIVNSIYPLDVLNKITYKKMMTCRREDIGNNAKFTDGKYKVNGVWYVTLREILTVDIALIAISTYILSGKLYNHLSAVTDFALGIFDRIF